MVSVFTPNVNLEQPARGDDVGTWDTPVNNNSTLIDLICGANSAINASAGNTTLSAAQFRSRMLTINSTLLSNIALTFSSTFIKDYLVQHTATGSSAFTVTLQTTVAGGKVIAVPPGKTSHVYNDGTNLSFLDLPPVGTYWDYAGSSSPNWNDACTVPPWINCDGTSISSATYPQLTALIGTTRPDTRGRARFTLDQSAGRISTSATGFSGTGVGASGGAQANTLSSQHIPQSALNDPTHQHGFGGTFFVGAAAGTNTVYGAGGGPTNTNSAATGITIGSSNPSAFTNIPPAYIGGLTLIRAG